MTTQYPILDRLIARPGAQQELRSLGPIYGVFPAYRENGWWIAPRVDRQPLALGGHRDSDTVEILGETTAPPDGEAIGSGPWYRVRVLYRYHASGKLCRVNKDITVGAGQPDRERGTGDEYGTITMTHIDTTAPRPVIAGTDIKVAQIANEAEHLGMTPDEIVEAHPHLTLAQVHAALSYYYDHQAEIRQEWAEGDALVAQLRPQYPGRLP